MGAFQTGFGFDMGMQAWTDAESSKERMLARERKDRLEAESAKDSGTWASWLRR